MQPTGHLTPFSSVHTAFESVRACVLISVPTGDNLGKPITRHDCTAYADVVLPRHHSNVCLSDETRACATILSLPMRGGTVNAANGHKQAPEVRVTVFLPGSAPAVGSTSASQALTRSGRGLADALALDERSPLYLTQAGEAVERHRHLSSTAYTSTENPLVFASGNAQEAWIQNVQLGKTAEGEYRGHRGVATPIEIPLQVSVNCSIDNCVGCIPKRVARDTVSVELLLLHSTCMAAHQCAVSRCVGTTVNMRKPLCNIGKVAASSLDALRVGSGGMWMALSRQIILIVELSHDRRKQYTVDAHEEIFNAAVCNTKDALVETIATITSTFGMVGYERVSTPGKGTRSANMDTRWHARSVLVLAASTNFITSIFMLPLYGVLAAEKTMTCLVNDVVLIVSNMAGAAGNAAFTLGSNAHRKATDNTVGLCLSQQMVETMREINTRSDKLNGEVGLVIGQINDLVQRLPFEPVCAVCIRTATYVCICTNTPHTHTDTYIHTHSYSTASTQRLHI